jgi:hypothetical protein
MDQLEASGVVGGFNGAKAREVLITDLHYLEQYLEDLKKSSKSSLNQNKKNEQIDIKVCNEFFNHHKHYFYFRQKADQKSKTILDAVFWQL